MTKSTRWILGFILIFSTKGFSQQKDSLLVAAVKRKDFKTSEKALAYAADKFTVAQPLHVEFKNRATHSFSSKYRDVRLPKAEVQKFEQIEVGTNIHILKREKWILGTMLNYRYTHTDAQYKEEGVSLLGSIPFNGNFHHWTTSTNFTYFSKLFDKNVIYTSSLIISGSDKHFEKVSGFLTGTMVLKANQKTKLMAGLIVLLDKGMYIPAIPSFSYEQKLGNGWTFDLILPRSVYLKKIIFQNQGRLSLGTELDASSFYIYNLDDNNRKYEYRQTDLYNGLMYEHVLGDFILTAKTGLEITPRGTLSEKGKSFRHPIYKTQHDPAFYFNIGVLVNPFNFFGQAQKN